MSFINSSGLDELARRLADSVPESVRAFGRDLEGNFKAVLQAQLSKLDLVNRQEFDVQAAILERTQAKLTAMEARLKEIEARLTPRWCAAPMRPCPRPRRRSVVEPGERSCSSDNAYLLSDTM